jgi:serine/threonine-protein kinase
MTLTSQTFLGPYKIDTLLGSGGTGDVYKAMDTRLNRTVAIKILKGPDIDRLRHEAQVIAAMNNPHICAIYDVGEGYLVMEYVEGTPIKGPLPTKEALDFATQIATALEAAHLQGIIHRDLKPANILITHGQVKLLDFGHAKQQSPDLADIDPVTLEGTVLGTAAYMSPEQARGKPVDPRSDIFSFGAVLYELLSGRRAFTGNTVLDVLNNIVSDDPRPVETTPEFRRIVTRCLCKDPAARFQSVSELKDALAEIQLEVVPQKHPTLAVLPFVNLSADPGNEYFSDGLTEEIINELSQIPGLRVTARTSAFVFRKRDEDIRKIAETLNVDSILEGSVRQSGTKVRVTAQLISAVDGCHLWSKTYDRELTEVFAIQDDIAGAIARALRLRLYHGPMVSIPAYETYLKARYYMSKRTSESLALSRECYEQAIALDSAFALAHNGYAEYCLVRALLGMVSGSEAMPVARAKAHKALDIDPSLPEARAVLGTVATLYDYDRQEAERQFELVRAHEGTSPEAHILHAFYHFLATDHAEEAEKELERALRDDPLNAALHYKLGVCRMASVGEAASREFHEALELDPKFVWAMAMLSMDYWWRGMNAEALAWAKKTHSLAPGEAMAAGLFAGMLVLNDEPTKAKRVVEELGDGQSFGAPIGLMVFDSLVGEMNTAAYWLEKALQQHCDAIAFELIQTPLGKGLTSGSWWGLLSKIGSLRDSIALKETQLTA